MKLKIKTLRWSLYIAFTLFAVNSSLALTNSPCNTNCTIISTNAQYPAIPVNSPFSPPINSNGVSSLCPVMPGSATNIGGLTSWPVAQFPPAQPSPTSGAGSRYGGCNSLLRGLRPVCNVGPNFFDWWWKAGNCDATDHWPAPGGVVVGPTIPYDGDWGSCLDIFNTAPYNSGWVGFKDWFDNCKHLDNPPNYWPWAVITEGPVSQDIQPVVHTVAAVDGDWAAETTITWLTNGFQYAWPDTAVSRMWGVRNAEQYQAMCGAIRVTIPAQSCRLLGCPFNTVNLDLFTIFSIPFTNIDDTVYLDGVLPSGSVYLHLIPDSSTTAHWAPFMYINTESPEVNQWFPDGADDMTCFLPGTGGLISNPTDEAIEFELAGYVFREEWEQEIPAGWSVVSRLNGFPGYLVSDFGFPYDNSTVVRLWDAANAQWGQYTVTNGVWSPGEPYLDWAEGALVYQSSIKTWYQAGAATPDPAEDPDIALTYERDGSTVDICAEHLVPGLHYTVLHSYYLDAGWHTNYAFTASNSAPVLDTEWADAAGQFWRLREDGTQRRSEVIGHYNWEVPAGESRLLAVQLDTGDNTLGSLFSDVPEGTYYYEIDTMYGETFADGAWPNEQVNLPLGWSFLIEAPENDDVEVPVWGEVVEGTFGTSLDYEAKMVALSVPITTYLNITGSSWPYGWPHLPDEDMLGVMLWPGYVDNYYWDSAEVEWILECPSVAVGEGFSLGLYGDSCTWSYSYTNSTP